MKIQPLNYTSDTCSRQHQRTVKIGETPDHAMQKKPGTPTRYCSVHPRQLDIALDALPQLLLTDTNSLAATIERTSSTSSSQNTAWIVGGTSATPFQTVTSAGPLMPQFRVRQGSRFQTWPSPLGALVCVELEIALNDSETVSPLHQKEGKPADLM